MPKISEAGREILKKWQEMGVMFFHARMEKHNYDFTDAAEHYSIPEQPVPDLVTLENRWGMEKIGLQFDVKNFEVRIPAQSIPKELLEMEEPKKDILISHPEERMLWLQQRIAGTNEQWQRQVEGDSDWVDLLNVVEPRWYEHHIYRVKPKTVKFYFGLIESKSGCITAVHSKHKEKIIDEMARIGATIIGNIEERDVEV